MTTIAQQFGAAHLGGTAVSLERLRASLADRYRIER
jgi:hypothetical protein